MNQEIQNLLDKSEQQLQPEFKQLAQISLANHEKVLKAFRKFRVSDFHLKETTGYGYDDAGREVLEGIYSQIFGTEAALVRPQIVSGTHAIALCLFGVLRPGDHLLSVSGKPYDTLEEIIGLNAQNTAAGRNAQNNTAEPAAQEAAAGLNPQQAAAGFAQPSFSAGSLRDFGVSYGQADLLPDGSFDWAAIKRELRSNTKMIMIQRSRGYSLRPALTIARLAEVIKYIRSLKKDVVIFVDNCYGEFVETREPTEVGADLVAGSLIKNIGGGLAATGGYIAGKKQLVELAANRWTAPGVGSEIGPTLGFTRQFLQGLFMAPLIVSEALKGAILTAGVFEELGYEVFPASSAQRADIVQSVILKSPAEIIAFCHGVQMASPIDSHVVPEPWAMPGYQDPVIMAAGTFTQGASIELSCDAPMRPPYTVYMQGGLSSNYVRLALSCILEQLQQSSIN